MHARELDKHPSPPTLFRPYGALERIYLAKDRERLLAVVEAGFGDFKEFNKLVRGVFDERMTKLVSVRVSVVESHRSQSSSRASGVSIHHSSSL